MSDRQKSYPRSWLIIVASAVTATVVDALILLPGVSLSASAFRLVVASRWPEMAVVWAVGYGSIALVLTTATVLVAIARARGNIERLAISDNYAEAPLVDAALPSDLRSGALWRSSRDNGGSTVADLPQCIRPYRIRQAWIIFYLVRLAAGQYFTALFALLGLGIVSISATSTLLSFGISSIATPSLTACAVLGVMGLVGGISLMAPVGSLVRSLPGLTVACTQLRLLREIFDLLKVLSTENAHLGQQAVSGEQLRLPAMSELVQWGSTIERLDRCLSAAVDEIGANAKLSLAIDRLERGLRSAVREIRASAALSTAIDRLGRGLRSAVEEIGATVAGASQLRPPEIEPGSPSAIEGTTARLWDAVAAMDSAAARLAEAAGSLSINGLGPVPSSGSIGGVPPVGEVSAALRNLLAEFDEDTHTTWTDRL